MAAIRESIAKSLPGCRWVDSEAPSIAIEIHRFSVLRQDDNWEAAIEWSVIARDGGGRTLTEFQAESLISRPNYRGVDNEKAALQEAVTEAMRRTLTGLRAVPSAAIIRPPRRTPMATARGTRARTQALLSEGSLWRTPHSPWNASRTRDRWRGIHHEKAHSDTSVLRRDPDGVRRQRRFRGQPGLRAGFDPLGDVPGLDPRQRASGRPPSGRGRLGSSLRSLSRSHREIPGGERPPSGARPSRTAGQRRLLRVHPPLRRHGDLHVRDGHPVHRQRGQCRVRIPSRAARRRIRRRNLRLELRLRDARRRREVDPRGRARLDPAARR